MGFLELTNETTGGGKHFELTYGSSKCPFAGIDSSMPDVYIGPNQLTAKSANVIAINGALEAVCWQQIYTEATSDLVIGIGDLLGQIFLVSFNVATTSINVTGYPNFPSATGKYLIGNVLVPGTGSSVLQPGTLTYKNVNGVCFFSFPWLPYIIQHNNSSAAVLTNYLGCAYLNELNGRLIAANIFQIAQAPQGSYSATTFNASIAMDIPPGTTQTPITSNVQNGWPSVAPGPTQVVNLVLTGVSTAYNNIRLAALNDALVLFQYSVDSGVTWTTFLTQNLGSGSFPTPNGTTSPQTFTIPITGIADISTVAVQVVASGRCQGTSLSDVLVNSYYASSAILIGDAPANAITEFPYQMAWSAPGGAYSQFNPLVNGLVTGAGFNNLPDVEDSITGIFMTGVTGYLLRQQGITEVSPLNSGINPFDFNHLWASHKGIGTVYPGTVGQYGSLAAFLSDTDIYSLGYSGLGVKGGKAKSAIYQELVGTLQANFISAGYSSVWLNGETFVGYVILAATPAAPYGLVLYLLNEEAKEWYRFTVTTGVACFGTQVCPIENALSHYIFVAEGANTNFSVYALPANTAITPGNATVTIALSPEEIAFMRDITIDAIGIYVKGIQSTGTALSATLSVTNLDGSTEVAFTAIDDTLATFAGDWAYLKLFPYTASGQRKPFTGLTPQIVASVTITGTAGVESSFSIGKIVAFGTMDALQRPV